jgi:DNA-directed RNA polymerase II subunit RPB1
MRPTEAFLGDDDQTNIVQNLRMLADFHLHDIRLRGFPNISKVSYTSNAADCNIAYYDENTGELKQTKGNWIIETDGCDLQNVFSVPGVDPSKTTSNHIIEILEVLGIEAARNALIRELRMILGTYEIYVNYRHLGTLVDVMT